MPDPSSTHDPTTGDNPLLNTLILGSLALSYPHPTLPLQRGGGNLSAAVGKYRIELRPPEGGLVAGEAVDVEFRVSDTTRKDPIEGLAGVTDANPTAAVTMPEMPGMPVQRPTIHREGVPGDYGLELFFPHGGTYKVGLRLAPTGGKPVYAAFNVDVKDASDRKPAPAPYRVEILNPPKAAGPVRLDLRIVDAKTGATVRAFDLAHTKTFHLMAMSRDLGWFVHEHPVQQSDGTFVWDGRLPAGGEYLVFADVAPKDRGSQVIGTALRVTGPPPKPTPLVRSRTARSGGIVATLAGGAFPAGRSTTLAFRLRDAAGRPVTDLQAYLGAQGHLMIVRQDGTVFVHSHPADDAAPPGEVRFRARFPKAGLYKAWAQFQRRGKVVTLPFVFRVG